MMKEHLNMFLLDGSIRLGTLFEFRNEEFHGGAVGDTDEGKYTKALESKKTQEFDLLSSDPRAVFSRQVIKGWDEFPDGVKLMITMEPNSWLKLHTSCQNYYMHCTTLEYSESGILDMGYNSCLAITNPYLFYREISRVISAFARYEIGSSVSYSSRVGPYDKEAEIHPGFVKPSNYQYQQEFRVLWSPLNNQEITPVIIKCPNARQYCHKYFC